MRTYQPTYLPTYVRTYVCMYVLDHLDDIRTYLPTYIRTYVLDHLDDIRTYVPTYLGTYLRMYVRTLCPSIVLGGTCSPGPCHCSPGVHVAVVRGPSKICVFTRVLDTFERPTCSSYFGLGTSACQNVSFYHGLGTS